MTASVVSYGGVVSRMVRHADFEAPRGAAMAVLSSPTRYWMQPNRYWRAPSGRRHKAAPQSLGGLGCSRCGCCQSGHVAAPSINTGTTHAMSAAVRHATRFCSGPVRRSAPWCHAQTSATVPHTAIGSPEITSSKRHGLRRTAACGHDVQSQRLCAPSAMANSTSRK